MARYANRGEATGLYAGGTVSTSAAYSRTGTAVTNIFSYRTTALSSLDFPAATNEIWARLDVYGQCDFDFAVFWDGATSNAIGIIGGTSTADIYYRNASGNRVYTSIYNSAVAANTLHTWKIHISPTVVEVWMDGEQKVSQTGASSATAITSIRTRAANNHYVSNIIVADYDCTNETLAGWTGTLQADTMRTLAGNVAIHGDTARLLGNAVAISADTLRTLTAGQEVTLHGDTLRTIANGITIHADTERTLTNDSQVTLSADTLRRLGTTVSLKADTARNVINRVTIHADAVRNIPRIIQNYTGSGIQSVSLTLAEKTLSDVFRMVTANPFSLEETVQGRLLDFPYTFKVETTSQRDLMQTLTGMYDVDTLLYNPIKYTVTNDEKETYRAKITNDTYGTQGIIRGVRASTIARKCCAGINKNAVVAFDDFFPSSAQDEAITNYQSILSGVFSWTSQVPRRQINVFMRQGNVHFLQRGHESGVINLDSYTHTRPTVDRSLVRTMWARERDFYNPMTGSSGVWGDWYIVSMTDPDINHGGAGASIPQRTISGDGLVQSTVERVQTEEGETVITTEYDYTDTGRTKFLTREIITKRQDGELVEQRTIDHFPLQNGQRYSVSYNEQGDVSSGLGTYPFADSMNEYAEETWELARGGHWVTNNGDTMQDSNKFPVNDRDTVAALYAELKWMNRRTQEQISLDVIGNVTNGVSEITHVFDFDTRYTLGGNEYYLVSNTVTLNPRQLIQTLNLVRWY